jgi:hypothetical protein
MKTTNVVCAATLLCLVLASCADALLNGPNGGQLGDAGKYNLELVIKGSALTVYVTGDKNEKIPTQGASGNAIVVTAKGSTNIKLDSQGENALAGSGFQAAPDAKILVRVMLPGQSSVQTRFTPTAEQMAPAKAAVK